ncbi:MAG: DNA polymerase III subunit alpha [Opitutae bacterium]|nr:DNA polymerase III subunit alpha [Opitutae bacterium]
MPNKDRDFVHLHVHSDYSLLDGCARMDKLLGKAEEMGMSAMALTDHGNLFGAASFVQQAEKHGVKPIIGCEAYLVTDHKNVDRPGREKNVTYHIGLLAKNFTGYQNLSLLVSDAHVNGLYYRPRTDLEKLAEYAEGLIGFTGCMQGRVPQLLLQDDFEGAREAMGQFVDIFGKENYFVELHSHGIPEQEKLIPDLVKLAEEFDLKLIASNDVHYVNGQDWQPHDALLCIQTGAKIDDEKRMRYSGKQFYLKSRQEMELLFSEIPESITNVFAVAEMCDVKLPFGENNYPVFPLPPEVSSQYPTNADYLRGLCIDGFEGHYDLNYLVPEERSPDDDKLAKANELSERLDYELGVIDKTGFNDYFLIVADFIRWSRDNDIPVGPGRGSGAGCLVAYLLGITDVDPLRFGLLFERFLNPERVSPPDFDIDFCMRRRPEVIEYVREKYGRDCVANIITFGTFGAKMVIRDIARVKDLPYAEADRLAKMIPDDLNITLEESLVKSPDFRKEYESSDEAKEIVELGKVIEGMVRNSGTHAAGVIIADRPLRELVPLTLQEGALTTQYPKDPVEQLGLLKMDFLGLKTLTVISDAEKNVRRTTGNKDFRVDKLPFEDDLTFELLNDARTIGVFQLESDGMRRLCRQMTITNVDEIIALIALYRPGPMEWIPDYLKGKEDPSVIKFPHPLLEDVCRETYGVMVYQEQVMEAARIIAGYTLGGADILRRAMGKKKHKEMAQQRKFFVAGAKEKNNIPEKQADKIFDVLEKFAGYGFNKSHSAAYGIISYQTAYLKANYPVEFMSGLLSSELGNADKVSRFIAECSHMLIQVLGPDVNESFEDFTPIPSEESQGSIRFGLAAIKGVGDAAAGFVVSERENAGPYLSFNDLAERLDQKAVNKRVLECLVKSGAFDSLGESRKALLEDMDRALGEVALLQKDRDAGQENFFEAMGGLDAEASSSPSSEDQGKPVSEDSGIDPLEKLRYEKELLGFYLSGHPVDAFHGLGEAASNLSPEELETLDERRSFRLCGVVSSLTKRFTKKENKPWARFHLEAKDFGISLNIFTEAFEKYGANLRDGDTVVVQGVANSSNGEVRVNVTEVWVAERALTNLLKEVGWVLDPEKDVDDFLQELRNLIETKPGSASMKLALRMAPDQILVTELPDSLRLQMGPSTYGKLRAHPAVVGAHVVFEPVPEPEPPRYAKRAS